MRLCLLKVKAAPSCPTHCDPWTYTVHGILQARILELVAVPPSRRYSQPRDQAQVPHFEGGFFTSWGTREAQEHWGRESVSSSVHLPNPGIEPGSPALQADSSPAETPGNPKYIYWVTIKYRLVANHCRWIRNYHNSLFKQLHWHILPDI